MFLLPIDVGVPPLFFGNILEKITEVMPLGLAR
jgi:hypothetical protein